VDKDGRLFVCDRGNNRVVVVSADGKRLGQFAVAAPEQITLHPATGAMYVLSPGEQEYCVPTCPSIGKHPRTLLTRFGSREDAEAAGFIPCTSCRPDLHPISH
jgi:hypothetical protein